MFKFEVRNTNDESRTKLQIPERSSCILFPNDRAEDQVKLLRFSPQVLCALAKMGFGSYDHPQPVLRFLRLFATYANLMMKVFPGHRVVGFAIVRSDAACGPHKLRN